MQDWCVFVVLFIDIRGDKRTLGVYYIYVLYNIQDWYVFGVWYTCMYVSVILCWEPV